MQRSRALSADEGGKEDKGREVARAALEALQALDESLRFAHEHHGTLLDRYFILGRQPTQPRLHRPG